MQKSEILNLRGCILWYGNDIELSIKIAKFLADNNEKVFNYDDTLYRKHTNKSWSFWRYNVGEKEWTRSNCKESLEKLPKSDIFFRKEKLKKLEQISKRRK